MGDRIAVVEDGVSPAPAPDRPRSTWLIVGVAFVVGLGLGVLVTSPDTEARTATTAGTADSPDLVPPGAPDGGEVEAVGISDVVEGFPDALVAISRTSGSTVDYLLWPVAGVLSVRPMNGGTDVILDASSRFVALSNDLPEGGSKLLSMGRYNSIRPVAPDATSYAFHDTASGLLAYTLDDGPTSRLFTVKSDFDPRLEAVLDESGLTVIGWGDWGWALQRQSGEIVLLNPGGEFKDSEPGVGLTTRADGWVLAVEGSELKLVSAGGGVKRLGPVEGLGTLQHATFSPDGSYVALDGERGLAVLDLHSGELERLSPFSPESTAWSSDSRFLISGSGSGAVVYAPETGDAYPLLRQSPLLAVGVVPLSSS